MKMWALGVAITLAAVGISIVIAGKNVLIFTVVFLVIMLAVMCGLVRRIKRESSKKKEDL